MRIQSSFSFKNYFLLLKDPHRKPESLTDTCYEFDLYSKPERKTIFEMSAGQLLCNGMTPLIVYKRNSLRLQCLYHTLYIE